MPNRKHRTSIGGIAVALGLTAMPLAAQEVEGAADLMTAYPELLGIEDRSCLGPLADFEARQGDGTLGAVLEGEATAADFPDADEDVVRCLQAAERAVATADEPDTTAPAPPDAPEDAAEDTAEVTADEEAQVEAAGEAEATAEAPDPADVPTTEATEAPPDQEPAPEAMADVAPDEPQTDGAEETAPAEIEAQVAEEPASGEVEAAAQPDAEAEAGTGSAEATVQADAEAAAAQADQDGGEEALGEALQAEQAADAEKEEAAATDPAPLDGAATTEAEPVPDEATPETAEAASDDTTPETAETTPDDATQQAVEAEVAEEAVQEDTEAATEAANHPVAVEAAEAADAAEAEDVETVVVTEESARTSAEEFEQPATEEPAAQEEDDDDIRFGQVAAGVLGGLILSEVLGATEEVVANTGDRIVVERGDGDYYVLKDENALLRQPGTEVVTQRFSDGSVRETVTRQDGTRVVTIRAPNGQAVRRERILPDGQRIVLFDDTERVEPVNFDELPQAAPEYVQFSEDMDTEALRRALALEETASADRRYSLRQVRDIRAVRNLVPTLQLETITFETGSAAIRPSEAKELAQIGRAMRRMIDANPYEVFLIEGHTDAVGSAAYNLALSDRRAESVALALTEYFDVPPESMVVQGYGESNLRVPTAGPEQANRRAAVRRITPLLHSARRP